MHVPSFMQLMDAATERTSMSTRRFQILVSYLLALLATLVLALLTARIPLAEFIATQGLESAGFSTALVHIQQFDMNRLAITRLDITRATERGTLRIEAQGVQIDYQPARLTNGRLEQIYIEQLILHQQSAADAPAEPIDNAALLQLLNTDWIGMVPFKKLVIEQLSLQGTGFGPLDKTAHRLIIDKSADTLESRLFMLDKPSQDRILLATLRGKILEIKLGLADKSAQSALEATIKTTDPGLDIEWRLLPKALQSWLSGLVNIADIGDGASMSGLLKLDLTANDLVRAKLGAETAHFRFAGYKLLRPVIDMDTQVNTNTQTRKIDIMPGSRVRFAGIESDTLTIGGGTLNLHAAYTKRDDQWSLDGETTLSRLPVRYTDYAFALKDIESRVHANASGITLNTAFSPETLPGRFVVDVMHSTETASGKADLRMPRAIDLDAEDRHLGELLAAWPFEFDLASGKLRLDGHAGWSGGALHELRAGVRLANIGGHYNELLFSGLNFVHQLELLPAVTSPQPSELTLEHIDAGIAIENVSARIAVGPSDYGVLPKLFVNDLKGHLFGGDFTGDPFAYDLNTPANALTIHAHSIDLAKVIATQQFHDIEVSGRIDGVLPIEINPFGVFINNGTLHNSTPAGIIRYRPSAGAGGLDQNTLTGIALKALSDFHYDTLKARANYVPDGTLTLNFELNGTSPPLQTTRPVHLNINTEQNLLSLLKSIRFVDGLSQGLDKSVREMYQRHAEH